MVNTIFPANPGHLPTPIGTLDDLDAAGSATTPIKTFIAHNLGHRTFLLSIPMYDFFRMSDVANDRSKHGEAVSQRKLDMVHAAKLSLYILRGLVSAVVHRRIANNLPVPPVFHEVQKTLGMQPYLSLQPIVANLRSCKPTGSGLPGYAMKTQNDETACFKVMLSQKDIMWVIDGQHRRKAMDLVFSYLDHVKTQQAYPKKKASLFPVEDGTQLTTDALALWQECYEVARTHCSVQVELHLGLGVDEERQLFHDLNNLGKKVEASLALKFDSSNPINDFIKCELIGQLVEASEKDITNWQDDDGSLARKDLVAVNAHLFLNKSNISGATPPTVEPKRGTAKDFWTSVVAIPGFGEEQARQKTVAAQPVVLKAVAKLTYDFAFGRAQNPEHLKRLLDGLGEVDFSHENPMWRFYELSTGEREALGLAGLADYLPSDEDGKNRDIGSFQGGVMRFGAKHNDIFPILGDMVRWKLGLPNRHKD